MSSFFDELDRRVQQSLAGRLQDRPEDLHNYQGCVNGEKARVLTCGCIGDCSGHNDQAPN